MYLWSYMEFSAKEIDISANSHKYARKWLSIKHHLIWRGIFELQSFSGGQGQQAKGWETVVAVRKTTH